MEQGDENANQDQAYQFSLDQRLWIALEKEKKKSTAEINAQFAEKWPGRAPPADKSTKFENNQTCFLFILLVSDNLPVWQDYWCR